MPSQEEQIRFDILVPQSDADAFGAALNAELERLKDTQQGLAFRVREAQVKGQSLELGAAELAKIIVAVGGGVGIAAVIKALSDGIAAFLKAKRGSIVVRTHDGDEIKVQNASSEEVVKVLDAVHRRRRSNENKTNRQGA